MENNDSDVISTWFSSLGFKYIGLSNYRKDYFLGVITFCIWNLSIKFYDCSNILEPFFELLNDFTNLLDYFYGLSNFLFTI